MLVAQLLVTAAAIGSQAAGALGGGITPLACALLLLFGLPHGTLDLELLRRRDGGGPGLVLLLCAYLACAGAMFQLWQLAPLLALGLFFAVAIEHFAEDWQATGARFVAYGTAVALVAIPALGHRPELAAIFVALTGVAAAARLGDLLLLVAPIAGAIAVAGIAMLWQRAERRRAIGLAGALFAEAILPPVVGFALFFCFVHSPFQLRDGLARLRGRPRDAWVRVVVPLTAAALAIAAAIGATAIRISLDAAALRASFVTLSVLMLPHMLVPYLARRYSACVGKGRAARRTPAVRLSFR